MRHLRIAAPKCRFLSAGRVTDDTSILTLKALVFEPLLRWRDGLILPGLFASWDISDDGRRWLFHLREGATFHDGVACTAQHILDYIGTILGSVDTFGMKWSYARYLEHARLSAPTRDTVLLENPSPFADILEIFSEFFPSRDDAHGEAVLGTGPYRVESFANDDRAELTRVFGNGPERITFLAMPAAEARLAALHRGDADAAINLERLESGPDFAPPLEWGRAVNTLSCMYYLNCSSGAFTHPAARRAINHAVDKQTIIDGLFHGLGTVSSSIVSPRHLGMRANPPAPFAHDPDEAKRLFDEAGTSGPLHIRTPLSMPEKSPEITAIIADSLARIGISTRIETQPDRPEYAREVGRKIIGDMAIFDSSPHSSFRVLNDKISSAVKGIWWQGHHDAELESLITAANHTLGEEAREAAYARCMHRLRANPPWLYLFHPVEVFAARPGTARWQLDATGALYILG